MDARIEKTRKKIREAYLAEKKTKKREEVRVSALCARAGINKTTFYNHYHDIFELSDDLEDELVEEIVFSVKYAAQDMFTDPRALFLALLAASNKQTETINLLFDRRHAEFIDKFCTTFLRKNEKNIADKRDKRLVAFCLIGSCFMLEKDFTEKNINETIDLLCEIIKKTRPRSII